VLFTSCGHTPDSWLETTFLELRTLLLIFVISIACSQNLDELYNLAEERQKSGNLREAINTYSKILAADPNEHLARFERSQLYVATVQPEFAMSDLNYLIEQESDDQKQRAFLYYHRAELNFKTHDFEDAIADYQRTLNYKEEPSIFMAIGDAFDEMNRLDSSIIYYQRGSELQPNNPKFHNRIGIAYSRVEDYNNAINWLSKAIDVDPNNALYYANRANAYDQLGDTEKAISDCHLVLSDTGRYANYQIVVEVFEELTNASQKSL